MDIKHVAKLATIPLSVEEQTKLTKQLADTVSYVDHLKKVPTRNVAPTAQVTGKANEFREDLVVPGLSREDALKNAKKTYNNFFVASVVWK